MKAVIRHEYSSMKHGDLIRIGGKTYVYDDCVDFHWSPDEEWRGLASAVSLVDEDNGLYIVVDVDEEGYIESIIGQGMDESGNYYYVDIPFDDGEQLIIEGD